VLYYGMDEDKVIVAVTLLWRWKWVRLYKDSLKKD